ncbi:hypothetical protein GQ44DRAFT_654991 [Phaeosphaeriaceae sp. PMI808]|nr:hypothetical protein GQ44DRAFT_654991 [Phaeosphaeriaceae sp. PMI808]
MSSLRLSIHSTRSLLKIERCIFCHLRQITQYGNRSRLSQLSIHPNGGAIKRTRSYATIPGQKLDRKRMRSDVDERARLGHYTLTSQQGILLIDSAKANSIAKEFLAMQKTMDPGSNVKHLASRYNVSVENLAALAIVTFKIPDLSDPEKRAMLPPSQHKPLSGSILQGCAQAEDPLAIIQILTAVYLAGSSIEPTYKEIASLFSQKDVALYRQTLEKLCTKSVKFALGPDALTLQGLFLEKEGQKEKATALYTEAVRRCHFKYNPTSRHPMQLPLTSPWNALGNLLKTDPDPAFQAQAKEAYRRGAVEGDDPISYYELASYEDGTTPEWLRYTSKAAASGHRQAMVDLANFYKEVKSPDSPALKNSNMRKALNWLLGWKKGSAETLAHEWLEAASKLGHKPSTVQLANHLESVGDREGAQQHLRRLVEPPISANQIEEWPHLVQIGKKRLAGIRP